MSSAFYHNVIFLVVSLAGMSLGCSLNHELHPHRNI